jgi:hypothetical protein
MCSRVQSPSTAKKKKRKKRKKKKKEGRERTEGWPVDEIEWVQDKRKSTRRRRNSKAGVKTSTEQEPKDMLGQAKPVVKGGDREKGRFRMEVRNRKRPGQNEDRNEVVKREKQDRVRDRGKRQKRMSKGGQPGGRSGVERDQRDKCRVGRKYRSQRSGI